MLAAVAVFAMVAGVTKQNVARAGKSSVMYVNRAYAADHVRRVRLSKGKSSRVDRTVVAIDLQVPPTKKCPELSQHFKRKTTN